MPVVFVLIAIFLLNVTLIALALVQRCISKGKFASFNQSRRIPATLKKEFLSENGKAMNCIYLSEQLWSLPEGIVLHGECVGEFKLKIHGVGRGSHGDYTCHGTLDGNGKLEFQQCYSMHDKIYVTCNYVLDTNHTNKLPIFKGTFTSGCSGRSGEFVLYESDAIV